MRFGGFRGRAITDAARKAFNLSEQMKHLEELSEDQLQIIVVHWHQRMEEVNMYLRLVREEQRRRLRVEDAKAGER